MELETLKVCIDGVDLSGKTSFWNLMHKRTNYAYKLEDRSFVTMYVYAKYHNRKKADDYYRQLIEDLSCMNHKYVLFDLPWEVIENRFVSRGDHLYDLKQIKEIYFLYKEIISEIENFPNVHVIRKNYDMEIIVSSLRNWIFRQEKSNLANLSKMVCDRVEATKSKEVVGLNFSFLEEPSFPQSNSDILDWDYCSKKFPNLVEGTVHEFCDMHNKFLKTIDDELNGVNMYSREENLSSRRFIFTQQACVSFIQVLVRDNVFYVKTMCRSSHVRNVFPADLELVYFFGKEIFQRLSRKFNLSHIDKINFEFTLNSAHIV